MTTTLLFITQILVAQANASVVSVSGRVEVTQPGASPIPLERFVELPQGGSIHTYSDGRAALRLPSGTLIRLAPDTVVELGAITKGDPAAKRRESVRMSVGRLWARVSRLFGDESSFEVNTENAVAGVRGTEFFAIAGPNGEQYIVDHGSVNVSNNGGSSVLLDGPGSNCTFSNGLAEGPKLPPGELFKLRKEIGGGAGNLLSMLAPKGTRQTEYLRTTIVGPDDLADDLQPGSRRTDTLGGAATVFVNLVITN